VTIPPFVRASTGSCLGMVRIRLPSVMTMYLPCRTVWNAAFSSALTAHKWAMPGIFGIRYAGISTFLQVLLARQLFGNRQVFANCVLNTRQSFFLSCALRPAPGQAGARDAVSLFGSHQGYWVLHASDSSTATTQLRFPFHVKHPRCCSGGYKGRWTRHPKKNRAFAREGVWHHVPEPPKYRATPSTEARLGCLCQPSLFRYRVPPECPGVLVGRCEARLKPRAHRPVRFT